jgi:hypothetical protein
MRPFEPTIEWWRDCLDEHGCADLAREFADDACWDSILKAHKKAKVPPAVIEAAVAAIAQCAPEHSFIAYTLMRVIGPREELVDKIIESENAQAAYAYCRQFGDDRRMGAVILGARDEMAAAYYCRDVRDDRDLHALVERGRDGVAKRLIRREAG